MKRILSIALAAVFALSLVSACKKQVPDPDPSIEIKTQTILVPTGETTATFTFVANNDWTVTSSDGWCRVSPTSGKASDNAAMVTVTLDPNTGSDTRSAKITIKAGGIEKQITVTQAPEEVVPENIVINYIWNSQDDTKIENRQIEARFSNWSANVSSYFTAIVQL
ncbi:MAG: BACON domain-containing protein, partial [Bacteroidales bacterium]|nr:BACON domain-containing protein [Bacteroidales bacterium]